MDSHTFRRVRTTTTAGGTKPHFVRARFNEVAAAAAESLRDPSERHAAALVLIAGLIGLAGAVASSQVAHLGVKPIAIAAGLVVAVPAAALAVIRFEYFVIAVFVSRSSLDALHFGDGAIGGSIDPSTAVGAMFVLSASFWLFIQHRNGRWVRTSRATRALFGLVIACALSCPASLQPFTSVLATIKILAGVLMFSVLEQLFARDRAKARIVIKAILASSVVPILVGLAQTVSGGGGITRVTGATGSALSSVQGTFTFPNPFGTYLVMILLMAVALLHGVPGRWKAPLVALVVVSSFLLLHTYARMAWISAVIGIAYLGLRLNRRILVGLVVAGLALVVAVPSVLTRFADLGAKAPAPGVPANSAIWRIGYWQELVPLAGRDPIDGIGLETVARTAGLLPQNQLVDNNDLEPHDVFVQAYVETGVLGLGALIAVILTMGQALSRRVRAARTPLQRALAVAGAAVGLALVVQFVSENLLSQTFVYWYLAGIATFGLQPPEAPDEELSIDGVADRGPLVPTT